VLEVVVRLEPMNTVQGAVVVVFLKVRPGTVCDRWRAVLLIMEEKDVREMEALAVVLVQLFKCGSIVLVVADNVPV